MGDKINLVMASQLNEVKAKQKERQEKYETRYINSNILEEHRMRNPEEGLAYQSPVEKFEFSSLKEKYGVPDIVSSNQQENVNTRPDAGKKQKEVVKQKKSYAKLSASIYDRRAKDNVDIEDDRLLEDKKVRLEEEKLMHKRLHLLDAERKAELQKAASEDERLKVEMIYSKAVAEEVAKLAEAVPFNTKQKRRLMDLKEKKEQWAFHKKRDYEISKETNIEYKDKLLRQEKRHIRYEYTSQKYLDITKDESFLEGSIFSVNIEGEEIIMTNMGRAYFGGTKPMYVLKGNNGKKYLYKKGITAAGVLSEERSAVTEAGATLQNIVCGEKHIPAVAYRDANGKHIGSIQEFIPTLSKDAAAESADTHIPKVNLFQWQDDPDSSALPTSITNQLLREHVLDWLLCNFDTKGENFLQRQNYSLISIDKEAAFKKIYSPSAQHMDYNYKPHKNDTIYNVVFKQFTRGKLELDFRTIGETVDRIVGMDDDIYLNIFEDYINKRSDLSPKKNKSRLKAKILERKINLKNEYMNFFGRLINERIENSKNQDFSGNIDTTEMYNAMLLNENPSLFSFDI